MKKPFLLAAAFAAAACVADADARAPVVSLPASVAQALRAIASASALREVAPADVADARLAVAIDDLATSLQDVDRSQLVAFLEAEIAALTPELVARSPRRLEEGALLAALERLLDEQARRILIQPGDPSDPRPPRTPMEKCTDELADCLASAARESPVLQALHEFRCFVDFLLCVTEGISSDLGGLADPTDQPHPRL